MKVLTELVCNERVVSWTDVRFEILTEVTTKFTVLTSVDVLLLPMQKQSNPITGMDRP
jgi:hypothetical protein